MKSEFSNTLKLGKGVIQHGSPSEEPDEQVLLLREIRDALVTRS